MARPDAPQSAGSGAASKSPAPQTTLGEGPQADTGFTQMGGPQRAATMSEAPDQTDRPARVEMQDEPGASGLDSSAMGGGVGAGAQRVAAPYRPDLGDSVLREAGAGGEGRAAGADASGDTGFVAGEIGAHGGALGATLGASPDRPPDYRAPAADADLDAVNEQQAELMQQATAQSGHPERSAPDQTRAEGRFGSINDTDDL